MLGSFMPIVYVLFAVGAVLVVTGLVVVAQRRRFLARAVATQGVVFNLLPSYSSEGGTTYQAAVRFGTADGRVGEFIDGVGSNPPRYQVGQVVAVRYDPQDIRNARMDSRLSMWMVPVILVLVGVTLLVVGVIVLAGLGAVPAR